MEPTSFVSAVDPVPILVSQKYIEQVSHGNPLSPAIDPLPYGTSFTLFFNISSSF